MNLSTSQKIYQVLTKRKYNRGKFLEKDKIIEITETAVSKNKPLKLVGFWCVGPKDKANWADEESCKFLNDLNEEIKHIYKPGIEFTFIFATLHGIHNGYDRKSIDSYTEEMEKIFSVYDFKYLFLDDLWKKYDISFEKIDSILSTKPQDWWLDISERVLIENNASKRNKKYPSDIAAQKYYIMRELEKDMFEKEFNGYIFHAFSDPKLKDVLPNMPTLYFFSREGWSNAPWFVT